MELFNEAFAEDRRASAKVEVEVQERKTRDIMNTGVELSGGRCRCGVVGESSAELIIPCGWGCARRTFAVEEGVVLVQPDRGHRA